MPDDKPETLETVSTPAHQLAQGIRRDLGAAVARPASVEKGLVMRWS